ncbi:MAG: response regulator transcription factor [Acidobacteriota bacterium]|nr:response regulator transcription factor [Acidobacteriota bacterium]
MIKILIIENETLVRIGICTILEGEKDFEIVGDARASDEGFRLFRETRPDVTLMSLRLPEACAVDEIEKFLAFAPKAKIIILASRAGDGEINRSLQGGAYGYILRSVSESELIKAIRTVAAGRKYIPGEIATILSENLGQEALTPSEQRILEMIVGGRSNKEIASELGISENTVKTHVKNIFEKLAVSDRTSAATSAIRRGLVRVDL